MELVPVRGLLSDTRLAAADQIRRMRDFQLPELTHFNSEPCDRHATLDDGMATIPPCRRCGIRFRRHQRIGVAWLYMRGRGLIADQVGTGKTAQAAGLIAVIKQVGELDQGQRVIVVCRAAAVDQWAQELRRFLPDTHIVTAEGNRAHRVERYLSRWEVLVTGSQMFIRDADLIEHFTLSTLVVDDVDPLRNPKSQTAYVLKRAGRFADRTVVLTGTPLQKKLQELHSLCELIGGAEVFGSVSRFTREFVREEFVKVYSPSAGRYVLTKRTVGYKNLDRFVQHLAPLTLRRTPAHIDDVDLPVIQPHDIYLDLTPRQRERYEHFRKGVLILRERGELITRAVASAAFIYGGKICAGLNTLGEDDGPGMSAKLDWVTEAVVDGDLSDEKVVVFCHFTDTVEALTTRLDNAGVGNVRIWGREPSRKLRTTARDRFWDDPTCRVLIGTEAIEQSLNLQVSRHLVNVDQLMNPARMQQLAGRIRRDGSAYRSVYVHNLLARGTQEEGYMDVLAREQALSDTVWGEANQLFEALNPLALLDLIGGVR